MKIKILIFVLIFFSIKADPLLVAVLMVKNEEPSMQMTLQPLIDAGITDYLIYDTGSTDNTILITRAIFQKNNISNYVIEQDEFVDFAVSRNKALEFAEVHFPEAVFILMLDAEWVLSGGEKLLQFCALEQNKQAIVYAIKIQNALVDFYHARLIRAKSGVQFFGKVHEVPSTPYQAKVPSNIYFDLSLSHYGLEKTEQRWHRDVELLLEELQENPENSRTMYYLAQTYFCLKNWSKAIEWYERRLTMQGWDEENFWACYRLAQAYQYSKNKIKATSLYLKAFQMRPHRADPLIRLAALYYDDNMIYTAFMLAKVAISMPYPDKESLPVDKWLYDFSRYNIISISAAFMNEYALGEMATKKALQMLPDADYLKHNLNFYQSMLSKDL